MTVTYAVIALVLLGIVFWLIQVQAHMLVGAAVLGLFNIVAHLVIGVVKF